MSKAPQSTTPARFFLGGVGLFLLILGLAFTWWLYGAGQRSLITRQWTPVPCTVLVSGVKEGQYSPNDPIRWQPELEYRYTFAGTVYHGTKLRRIEGPTPHRAKALAAAAKYPKSLRSCLGTRDQGGFLHPVVSAAVCGRGDGDVVRCRPAYAENCPGDFLKGLKSRPLSRDCHPDANPC